MAKASLCIPELLLWRAHHYRGWLVGVLGREQQLAVVVATRVWRICWAFDDEMPLKDVVGPERTKRDRQSDTASHGAA
jgi:hypothetical protein